MSSMRNAVARRNHKERAQPLEREKWGILEKHKDYSLRAKDFNSKKARLKVLREKAEQRNPDEFHYAMMSTKVDKNGFKIGDRGNKVLDHRVVKLLKTQDAGYIRTMRTGVKREIERLEMVVGTNNVLEKHRREEERNGHLRFMDEESLKKMQALEGAQDNLEDSAEDDEDGLDKSNVDFSDPVQKAEYKAKLTERKRERRSKEVMRVKLRLLKEREQGLAEAEAELEAQRAKIHNVVGGVNKDGVKFKVRERKR